MNYDIINKNLTKLDEAIKIFPDIVGRYRKSSNTEERQSIKNQASKVDLLRFLNFIDWIDTAAERGYSVVYNHSIPFDFLKKEIEKHCVDEDVKKFISRKTKKGFITFLNSELYSTYDSGRKGTRNRRTYYSSNFTKTKILITNYIIQNDISITRNYSIIPEYYVTEMKNFESEINTELEITNDITKSIITKINSIKYDFRKINFNLLKSEIENKIKEKILSITVGEQLKCIESAQIGITVGNLYNVNGYDISSNGNLVVSIKNDDGVNMGYSYRLFETISKLRNDNIDNILNMFEND